MRKVSVLILLLLFTGFFFSCTKRPSPEQISTLEAAEQTAEAAEVELSALEQEYTELESELERAKIILSENQSERDLLKDKLGK